MSSFAYFDTFHHFWYPKPPTTYSQGWKQGYWLSSISDRDSCPGHIFIIKPLLTVKTAEHSWGDWAKLPQETCWFQPPGRSRCSDLLFILLNTFIDLLSPPNEYKGRSHSFPHGASTGPRNWSQADVRKQEAFYGVPALCPALHQKLQACNQPRGMVLVHREHRHMGESSSIQIVQP